METTSTPPAAGQDASVEAQLKHLYALQCVDSKIDALVVLQGELPLEVKNLEQETADVSAQQDSVGEEIKDIEALILQEKGKINTSNALINKYKSQIDDVRNQHEHEALTKEIEFQILEIELSEKKINGYIAAVERKNEQKAEIAEKLAEKQRILQEKKGKLEEITNETQKEIEDLRSESDNRRQPIEKHLLAAYDRVRGSAHNGYAVALVQRGACGGCFHNLPPQRQVDIKLGKKIAVCEYCGRFIVSDSVCAAAEPPVTPDPAEE